VATGFECKRPNGWWLILLLAVTGCGEPRPLTVQVERNRLPANGSSGLQLAAVAPDGSPVPATFRLTAGARHLRLESGMARATVLPGSATVIATARGFRRASVTIETLPVHSDRAADGTPDFLRLDEVADREAFARWFTLLAEAQFARRTSDLPAEISDCAGLIRFAYREALREHDAQWADRMRLPPTALPPDVRKYAYPFTPLGAALFRVSPGSYHEKDLRAGAFAEFADAQTLMRRNTHFISRELDRAEASDLLFFRQLEQNLPFHVMIVLGRSSLQPSPERWIIYHTGPSGVHKGEIRRPTFAQLLGHPSPQWRPVPGNANFLGVYRWNILREMD
jgi:uncharacterized protein